MRSAVELGTFYTHIYDGNDEWHSSHGPRSGGWRSEQSVVKRIYPARTPTYDNSYNNHYGTAIGAENSIISTDSGNDTVAINVVGGTEAIGLRNSNLSTVRLGCHQHFTVAEGKVTTAFQPGQLQLQRRDLR